MESLPYRDAALLAAFIPVAAIMPQAMGSGKPRQNHANTRFSAKRNALVCANMARCSYRR
jgi:hypothetical protein